MRASKAVTGDCSFAASGAITCPRTSGVSFQPSATTDTTNAANISSGTLPLARIPASVTALFSSTSQGQVPASGGGTTTFMRADGSWAIPPGTGSGSGSDITGLVFNSTGAATANTSIIQAALNATGNVSIGCPANSIIYVNSTLTIFSNTKLNIAPTCTITASASYFPMLINNASSKTNVPWTMLYNNSGVVTNGPLSLIRETDVATWGTSQSYSKGAYTVANGNIYWESVTSCTAASSGSGPSGTGTGITDNTCAWNYVTTYTVTGFSYPTIFFNDPTQVVIVNYPNHGLSVGQSLWLTPEGNNGTDQYWSGTGSAHTAGGPCDSAYFGIFTVVRVNNSNNVTVILRRGAASAFSGIPMLVKAPDTNITVTGRGTWNYNYPTNSAGGNLPIVGYNLYFGGIEHFLLDNIVVENSFGYQIYVDGLRDFTLSNLKLVNSYADAIKAYGPLFDGNFENVYGYSYIYHVAGDDFFTLMTEEYLYNTNVTATGDILNIKADNIVDDAGLKIGAWMSNQNLFMDNLDFSRIGGIDPSGSCCAGVVSFYNPQNNSAYGGVMGHVSIHDISTRGTQNDIFRLNRFFTTVNQLNVYNVNINPTNSAQVAHGVYVLQGSIGQVNFGHSTAFFGANGCLVCAQGTAINEVNVDENTLNFGSSSSTAVASAFSGGTFKATNLSNNYITGSPQTLVSDVNGQRISLINNYLPTDTNALATTSTSASLYLANNYAPLSTGGALGFTGTGATATVYSGGGNVFSNAWFSSATGNNYTVYGWDIKCDVTLATRTTGEYCSNTNTSPGSGTLTTAGPVMDQGTTSGSWFAMSNPAGQTF